MTAVNRMHSTGLRSDVPLSTTSGVCPVPPSSRRLDDVLLLHNCNPAFLDSLSVLLRETSFSKDSIIFRQNEVASEMHIIVTGSVERRIEVSSQAAVPVHAIRVLCVRTDTQPVAGSQTSLAAL